VIAIYSEIKSPRLTYVCDFVFKKVMAQRYKLYDSYIDFENSSDQKINYSSKNLKGIQITPNGLLEEKGLNQWKISNGEWRKLPIFFTNSSSQIPFDVFSAVFYLISRYEEYLPSERDSHDRYKAMNSILYKLGILHKPIVDLWCQQLHLELFGTTALSRTYSYLSTIDVDNAYAYKFKSFWVKAGGTIRSVLRRDKQDLRLRIGCYFRKQEDPYDNYDVIDQVHKSVKAGGIYFFLLSDKNEKDRNLSYTNKHYRSLISALQRENQVGIHPGYRTSTDPERTHTEKVRLEDIIGKEVLKSRQHFLKFKFPETARNLVQCGVEEDYSMGYAEELGFRAGTCTPFRFFDLQKNESSSLEFHSSPIMDATLNRYLSLSPDEAISRAKSLITEVESLGGEMVTIWHNETLSEINEWKGWTRVFKEIVSHAAKTDEV